MCWLYALPDILKTMRYLYPSVLFRFGAKRGDSYRRTDFCVLCNRFQWQRFAGLKRQVIALLSL